MGKRNKAAKQKLTEEQKRKMKLAVAWTVSAIFMLTVIIFGVSVKTTLDNSMYIYRITVKGTLEIQLSCNSPVYIYDTDPAEVVIPEKIAIFKVSALRDNAFWDAHNVTNITIPEGIKSIGSAAFGKCSGLTSIIIPNSVSYIGEYAFQQCTGLTSISIPNEVDKIEEGTFYRCDNLESVSIPESVTDIGVKAFAESGITSIVIPESVTTIGKEAFYGCEQITEVTIPKKVAIIPEDAFRDCEKLQTLTISPGTKIKDRAFCGCNSLVRINFTGTAEEWISLGKGYGWDSSTPDYTVYCTDGTVSKSGVVTLN